MTPAARQKLLWRLGDLVEEHAAELGDLDSSDQGQSVGFARGSMSGAADMLRYFAGWCTKITGVTGPVSVPGMLHYTRREPVGVCALITPWNFRLAIAVWKPARALADGNTVVLKPAEQTPLMTLRLAALCLEAGIPPGVVNCVTGGPEVGRRLTEHPRVEPGGKAPNIVLADADIDAAVTGSLLGGLVNSGQAGAAYSRFYVHSGRSTEFTDKLAAAMSSIKVGPGSAPDTQLGPLVVTGGRRGQGDLAAGYFFEPTLFVDVADDMAIAREEIFGPVLPVLTYDDPADSWTGPTTCRSAWWRVWTRDIALGHRMAAGIRAGEVYVNSLPMLDPAAPWGGFTGSGWSREMTGEALNASTGTKGVWVDVGT